MFDNTALRIKIAAEALKLAQKEHNEKKLAKKTRLTATLNDLRSLTQDN